MKNYFIEIKCEDCFRYFHHVQQKIIVKIFISELFYFCNDQMFSIFLSKWLFQSNFSFFHNDSHLLNFLLKTIFQIFSSTMSNFGVFDLQLEVFNIIISDFYYFQNEHYLSFVTKFSFMKTNISLIFIYYHFR